jgi:hypothetical protein
MPYFNGRTGSGRRSGTVTVIEEPVRRSHARTAKIVAYVAFLVVGALAATVLSSRWHPIVALIIGALVGLAAAWIAAAMILAWPVVRALWWWAAEILTIASLILGWVVLAEHTTLPVRLTVVALTGGAAAIPPVRRAITAVAWCVIIRHRIRTCFSEFIITNRTGSLPLIMWARPTPAGVRTWLWLRPGLALTDIQDRLDLIAVTCWADSATAEAASATNSAYIRLDIKRRDALAATVDSPLVSLVPPLTWDEYQRDAMPWPTALDLPDVAAADVTPARPPRRTTWPTPPAPAAKVPDEPVSGDDITDWI